MKKKRPARTEQALLNQPALRRAIWTMSSEGEVFRRSRMRRSRSGMACAVKPQSGLA